MKKGKYTGINRLFKSDTLQTVINTVYDGTFKDFWNEWKWIFTFSKKYRAVIVFYTFIGILSSTLSLGAAYVSKILINIIIGKQVDKVWLLLGTMIGMALFSLLLTSINNRIFASVSINVNNDIQAEIFDKIIDAQWKELSDYKSGDLLNRFNNDVGTISSNAIAWIPNLIINVYTFALTFMVLFQTDHAMAWIAFLSAPFLLLMSRYIMRKMREYRQKVLKLNSQMMSFETETFYNIDTVKSFGIFGYYSKKLKGWQKKFKEYNLEYNKFEIKSKILLTLVSTFVSLIAFCYCLYRLWNGQIQYGDMTFFLQQRASLSNKFNSLVGTVPGMLNSAVSAHRIRQLVNMPREEHDPKAYEQLKSIADKGITVEFNEVTFAYSKNNDKQVYENAVFSAAPGEIVAVLSPSGGGKTTLMRLLLGMVNPDSGSVTLKGSDDKKLLVNADLRRFFSYVPQGNTIFSGTVAENMRSVREDATDGDIIEALKTACAYEFVSEMPGGINGIIGEHARGISEGQAQRLAIARAVLRNSPILLLDEATSALDIDTEEQVLKNIKEKYPNKTVIISTHRPGALKLCKRIYRIVDGKIIKTDALKAEQLMWRYANIPNDRITPIGEEILPDISLSPKDESGIIPKDTNEGWFDI